MPSAAAEVKPNPKISPRPSVAHHPNSPWGPPGLRLLNLENVAWLAPVSQPDLAGSVGKFVFRGFWYGLVMVMVFFIFSMLKMKKIAIQTESQIGWLRLSSAAGGTSTWC